MIFTKNLRRLRADLRQRGPGGTKAAVTIDVVYNALRIRDTMYTNATFWVAFRQEFAVAPFLTSRLVVRLSFKKGADERERASGSGKMRYREGEKGSLMIRCPECL